MLKGEPATEQCVVIDGGVFLLNSDVDGKRPPPAGAPNIMMSTGGTQLIKIFEDDGIYFYKVHVDWSDPSKTTRLGAAENQGRALPLFVRRAVKQLRVAAGHGATSGFAGRQADAAAGVSELRQSRVDSSGAFGGDGGAWRRSAVVRVSPGRGARSGVVSAGDLCAGRIVSVAGKHGDGSQRQYRDGIFVRGRSELSGAEICGPVGERCEGAAWFSTSRCWRKGRLRRREACVGRITPTWPSIRGMIALFGLWGIT